MSALRVGGSAWQHVVADKNFKQPSPHHRQVDSGQPDPVWEARSESGGPFGGVLKRSWPTLAGRAVDARGITVSGSSFSHHRGPRRS